MPYSNEIGTLSVIDPRRPENNRRDESTPSSYTWAPRVRSKPVPKVAFSLGWELEANHKAVRYPDGIYLTSDGSVNGDEAEYVVMPSIVKSPKFVLGLLKDLVHAPELNTDKSCGYHVHFAPRGKSLETMRKWAVACETLAIAVESEAFAAVPDARHSNNYCRKIVPLEIGTRFQSSKFGNDRRYQWLNTVEMFRPGGIRTVEIRLLGNTHRWKYLLSWSTFCLVLAHGAWKLVYKPESKDAIVDKLKGILGMIKLDVKPLDKRSEPIPQQVYDALKQCAIDYTVWERPLAKLSAAEHAVKGLRKVWYSDAQPTLENDRDDSDSDSCPCGCGEDCRCQQQTHDDGDCDNNECSICHDEGNCGSAPDCYQCRDVRHDSGEYCGRLTCGTCTRASRIPQVSPLNDRPEVEAAIVASAIDNPANYSPVEALATVQAVVNEAYNQNIDNVNLAIAPSWWEINAIMSCGEAIASENREARYRANSVNGGVV